MDTSVPESPYKFLDHYEFDPIARKDDRKIFFGRERETRILLADVLVSRLVVLFARTGTGKTSLINAGVRPRLEERDYRTFHIRVREDPVTSARLELERQLETHLAGETLAELAAEVARLKPDEPIVLFFDQFEEFFIYVRPGSERGRRFIADVAALTLGPDSDFHLVFSMREEFFHEMNEFREEIPTIFHNDSNLRLHWFDEEQAREAIVEPARFFGVGIDRELEDRLIRDLQDRKENDRIEPAQLQIVCDTLWRETESLRQSGEKRITLDHYNTLGRKGSRDTIAVQILYRRLEEMFGKLESQSQLYLLYALLPKLCTPWKTKYVRDVLGVVQELTLDDNHLRDIVRNPSKLRALVERLATDDRPLREVIDRLVEVRFLRKSLRDRLEVIELSHDYLVAALEPLQERVKIIALRQRVKEAMVRSENEIHRLAGPASRLRDLADLPQLFSEEEREALYMARDELEAVSEGYELLEGLTREEAEFLFTASLEHGIALSTWFEMADASEVDVWEMLQLQLEGVELLGDQVKNALQLLGELRGTRALQLLESALRRQELAPMTLEVLGKIRTGEAVSLLATTLSDEELASQAIDVLRRMRTLDALRLLQTTARDDSVQALKAALALDRIADRPEPDEVSIQAGRMLKDLLNTRSQALFLAALQFGEESRFWFDKAAENGVDVWNILQDIVLRPNTPRDRVENAVRLLATLEGEEAKELLKAIKSTQPKQVVTRGQDGSSSLKGGTFPLPETSWRENYWEILRRSIATGRCVPVLGSGLLVGIAPLSSDLARELAHRYDYPNADEADLTRVAQYLAATQDGMFPKELIARETKRFAPPDFSDPDNPHRFLASLGCPTYATTTYDDMMEQALQAVGRKPKQAYSRWNRDLEVKYDLDAGSPSPSEPSVFHFFGIANTPDSLVLTEDDYFDFLLSVQSMHSIPPEVERALSMGSLLFLGVEDLGLRVLLRVLERYQRRSLAKAHFLVLPPPRDFAADTEHDSRIMAATQRYYDRSGMIVYWGTVRDFLTELRRKWEEFTA